MEGQVLHTCKLLRDPVNIDEFEPYNNVAVVMSNGTLTLMNIEFGDGGPHDLIFRKEEEYKSVSLVQEHLERWRGN